MRLYLVSEIRHAAERFIEVKRSYHWVEGSLGQALGVLEVPLRLPVHSIEHSWSRGHSPSVSRYRDLLGWVFFFFFRLSSRENPLKFPIMRVQASPNS